MREAGGCPVVCLRHDVHAPSCTCNLACGGAAVIVAVVVGEERVSVVVGITRALARRTRVVLEKTNLAEVRIAQPLPFPLLAHHLLL